MNYNKKIKALKKVFMDDGMGGGLYEYQEIDEIKCAVAPVKKQRIIAGGREETFNILKVFTRELINQDDLAFEYEGQLYGITSYTDYGKVILYELEVL